MNRMRTLLLMPAWELSPGTGAVGLQAASKQNLLQRRRRASLQDPSLVPVRNFQASPVLSTSGIARSVRGDKKDRDHKDANKSLVTADNPFERGAKTKAVFQEVVDVFCKQDIRRRGHVEFIYMALRKMKEFGVERDIAVYNKILDVFPKEVFVPQNFIQRMYNHYPRQQECGIQVLEQMESNGVMPNKKTWLLLLEIFGDKSHPVRKYQRMLYWFSKFKNINPYPVPDPLPEDPVDLARLSLQRIANDLDARITAYQLPHVEVLDSGNEVDHPHIIGIQSPKQQALLARHNPERPVFVEGPFRLWLKNACVYYYVLQAELLPPEERKEEVIDPERNFYYPMQLHFDLERGPWDDEEFDIDEVEEGPVFAMCMAGAGDQATLAKWIVGLQETNLVLSRAPVVFRLTPGPRELRGGPDLEQNGEEETVRSQSCFRES